MVVVNWDGQINNILRVWENEEMQVNAEAAKQIQRKVRKAFNPFAVLCVILSVLCVNLYFLCGKQKRQNTFAFCLSVFS